MVLSGVPLQVASLSFAASRHQEPELGQSEKSMGKFGRLVQATMLTAPAERSGRSLADLGGPRDRRYARRFALGGHTRFSGFSP